MKLQALREIVEERKEKAIESLSDSFAKNKLPLEEYERLVEYINKIESERELVVVEKIVREYGAGYDASDASLANDNDEDEVDDYHGYDHFSQSGSNLTFLSSRNFSGPLKSGAQFVSILGSEHIKIRKSDLEKRRTVLNVVSILGESTISVESGIRVINRAVPILGGAWTDRKVNDHTRQGDAELIISGAALLGNITVKLLQN
jgi:hypothetical protein